MRNTRRRRQSKRRVATQRHHLDVKGSTQVISNSLNIESCRPYLLVLQKEMSFMTGQKASSNDCRLIAMMRLKNRHAIRCGTTLDLQESVSCCFPLFFVPMVYKTIHMDWPFMHVEPWLGTHCSGPEKANKSLRWSK